MVINQVVERIPQKKKKKRRNKNNTNRLLLSYSLRRFWHFSHSYIFGESSGTEITWHKQMTQTNYDIFVSYDLITFFLTSIANVTNDLLCPFSIFISNRITCARLQDKYPSIRRFCISKSIRKKSIDLMINSHLMEKKQPCETGRRVKEWANPLLPAIVYPNAKDRFTCISSALGV